MCCAHHPPLPHGAGLQGQPDLFCSRVFVSVQVVLWVGLGVLVVSTHTTLSVSEEAPVDVAEEALAGRLEEAEGVIKAEAARLPGTHTAPQPPRGTPAASPRGRGVQKVLSRLSHLPLSCRGDARGRDLQGGVQPLACQGPDSRQG